MTKRIYKAICLAALGVFVVTMLLIMGALYEYFSAVQQSQLRSQTILAAQGVEKQGMSYFEGLSAENFRITWIAADGNVLYDSVSDSDTMENHLYREEIREALETGSGDSSRYSSTLLKRSLYSAQQLQDGTVLRLSIAHNTAFLLLIGMLQPILIIIAIAAVLAFILANRLSKRIVEPMNRLNLDHPMENEGYEELEPLFRRIHSQQQQLRIQKSDLQHKQNEFDAIVSQLEEGMLLVDRWGKIITANLAAARMLAAKSKIITGQYLSAVNGDSALQQAVQAAVRGTSVSRRTILQGKTIQIQAAAVGPEGEVSGVAVVLFDITQQEQAEQQRREFTANVSHELKTPLQSISGYSELIKCGVAKPEDIQPFAERIYAESQRLISLVEDIINLSHLDEQAADSWTQLDLYEEAKEVTESLSAIAAEKQISLTLEGESASVRGVADLIHAIIYNLCDNAIKYNKPNGSVAVSVRDASGEAVLCVRDNGIGIPAEAQDRIFERFYRVDKSHSKEIGGTGLGLSIVKHAAMVHNAKITVDSVPGEGTAIFVRFPK